MKVYTDNQVYSGLMISPMSAEQMEDTGQVSLVTEVQSSTVLYQVYEYLHRPGKYAICLQEGR